MCFPNTSQIHRGVVRNPERSETQLHTVRGPRNRKGVGFLSVFCFMSDLWREFRFALLFRVLRVSVQPNLQDYTVFSKIDTYGAVRKPHLPGRGKYRTTEIFIKLHGTSPTENPCLADRLFRWFAN